MSPNNKPPLKQLAWNGIALKIPVIWEVDSLDADHMLIGEEGRPRVEIKWTDAPAKFTLVKHLKRFITQSQRQLNIKIHEQATPELFSHPKDHLDFFFFTWESKSATGEGALIFCNTCSRLTLIRFFSGDTSISAPLRHSIISSFNDHPERDRILWQIFGLEFSSPQGFTLQDYSFKPGAYRVGLKDKRVTLEVFSWGPAGFLLSDATLHEFASGRLPQLTGFAETGFCVRGNFLEWRFKTQRFKNADLIPFLKRFSLFSIFRICHDAEYNRIIGVLVNSPNEFRRDIIKRSMIGDV